MGGYISHRLTRHKELEFQRREQKEKRYKSILLFMDAYLDPKNITYLKAIHPAMKNERDTKEWLKAEYHEMVLYASREVILAVKSFIDSPSEQQFLDVLLAMRRDLWVKKRDLRTDTLELKKD